MKKNNKICMYLINILCKIDKKYINIPTLLEDMSNLIEEMILYLTWNKVYYNRKIEEDLYKGYLIEDERWNNYVMDLIYMATGGINSCVILNSEIDMIIEQYGIMMIIEDYIVKNTQSNFNEIENILEDRFPVQKNIYKSEPFSR